MDYQIGALDTAARSVPVTFTHGEVTHTRSVNACYDADGNYDEEKTGERVSEVARGVEYKIDAGIITNLPDPVAPEAPPAGDDADEGEADAATPEPGADPA